MRYSELQGTLQNLTSQNVKLTEIANCLGITRQALNYNITQGKSEVSKEEIEKLEKAYGVSLEDGCLLIEHIGINPSCGKGTSVYYDPINNPIEIGVSLIKNIFKVSHPKQLKTFTASGDSMAPLIEHGDLLLVDTGDIDFAQGGVFLITINNDWFIKRLRKKITGELDIISDNPKYPIETLSLDTFKDVEIKGRVLKNLSRGI